MPLDDSRVTQIFHMHARRRRALGAVAAMAVAFSWLGFSFYRAQVLQNTSYTLRSEANRLRPIPVPAPRGTIFDRYGDIIAGNVPGYALSLLPESPDTLRARLERLAPVLGLSAERIDWLLSRYRRHQPLLVSSDLTFEQVSAIEEQRLSFPGILIETRPKRYYPDGPAVAHLTGYISEISERELSLPLFEGYTQGTYVGKTGLERQYERLLGGRPGTRYVEVDALGRIMGDFAPQPQEPPTPGTDLQIHVDLGLQQWMARIFPPDKRGAMVALEPRTGHVLGLYSAPSYDPNAFVDGISAELWRKLNTDPAQPLVSRATQGLYPPGSTFKLATAAVALELGVIDPEGYMPRPCSGRMQYGNRYFRCWRPEGHGFLTLPDAIKHSCNVYFYQVGLRVGLERFLTEVNGLRFTSRTGIDLPGEVTGIYPTDLDWYRRRWGWPATETEVLSLAIGQGANDQTVLGMAQFFAALAGDGSVGPPRIVSGPEDESREGGLDLGLSPENLEWLREGLRRVVSEGGTAFASSLEHWQLAGKTGTSQNPHGEPHAWFVGMAGPWGGEPEVVVAAIVEAGESGSAAAAPLVAKAADYYLRKKYGMPIDTIQTLRDHINAGRPAPWAYGRRPVTPP